MAEWAHLQAERLAVWAARAVREAAVGPAGSAVPTIAAAVAAGEVSVVPAASLAGAVAPGHHHSAENTASCNAGRIC